MTNINQTILAAAAATLFLGIGSIFDFKTKEIPVWLFLVFGIVGVIFCAGCLSYQTEGFVQRFFPGLVFLAAGYLTKESVGYGDGIGIFILGFFLDLRTILGLLLLALGGSASCGALRILFFRGKATDTLPLFPFLLTACLLVNVR